jgi:hypothetical protein
LFTGGAVQQAGKPGTKKKSALEKLTGIKTSMMNIGKKHKTVVPYPGEDKTMLIRTSVGDPGPQVLSWADAFLIAFNASDRSTFDTLGTLHTKVCRYRKAADLPCMVVAVEGLDGSVPGDSDEADDSNLEAEAEMLLPGSQYHSINPMTGVGVVRLFHNIVHQVVKNNNPPEVLAPLSPSGRSGKKGKKYPSPTDSMPDTSIRKGKLRKAHAHGGHADRYAVLTDDALTYYRNEFECVALQSASHLLHWFAPLHRCAPTLPSSALRVPAVDGVASPHAQPPFTVGASLLLVTFPACGSLADQVVRCGTSRSMVCPTAFVACLISVGTRGSNTRARSSRSTASPSRLQCTFLPRAKRSLISR